MLSLGWIILGVVILAWVTGAFHLVPMRLHNCDGKHYLKRAGGPRRYDLWVPVKEVIPHVLYLPSGERFFLDDEGFNKGRK